MADPALQLAPAEEALGEAAAQQTARLIVIEGGKGTAAAAEGTAGEELIAGLADAVLTTGAAVAAALLVLLWPSSIGPEPEFPRNTTTQGDSGQHPVAPPVQETQTMVAECPAASKQPKASGCPPHQWVVVDPGKSLKEGIEEKDQLVKHLSRSPSRSEMMRGQQFERDAMEANGRQRQIKCTGRVYRCLKCGAEQEVDIIFEDGQIAEAKSRSFDGIKKKGKQAARYVDIQSWLNETQNTTYKPLAKIDESLPDADQSAAKYVSRGHQVEPLNFKSPR
jgi:hypothetical protein